MDFLNKELQSHKRELQLFITQENEPRSVKAGMERIYLGGLLHTIYYCLPLTSGYASTSD